MHCPFCLYTDTQVKDSRISDDGLVIKRRRVCPKCNSRFTTTERIQLKEICIVKKNGRRESFSRDKLLDSIKMAVRKRDVDEFRIDTIINDLVRKLETYPGNEISSSELGEMVMEELKKLDKVSYVRFASVYKNFSTAEDFQNFIKDIL